MVIHGQNKDDEVDNENAEDDEDTEELIEHLEELGAEVSRVDDDIAIQVETIVEEEEEEEDEEDDGLSFLLGETLVGTTYATPDTKDVTEDCTNDNILPPKEAEITITSPSPSKEALTPETFVLNASLHIIGLHVLQD